MWLVASVGLRTAPPVMQIPREQATLGLTGFSGVVTPSRAPAVESSIPMRGGSRRTWSFRSPYVDQVQVVLSTEGRQIDADIELWNGPDSTPCRMRIYVEDGQLRPFSAVIETPRLPNTLAVRNIDQSELPIVASVEAVVATPSAECKESSLTVQGGALQTYAFDRSVDSVQCFLMTDGQPLNARIELLQGLSIKQVIELYTEDGRERPFFCFIETPGSGNIVRVVNTGRFKLSGSAVKAPRSWSKRLSSVQQRRAGSTVTPDAAWRWRRIPTRTSPNPDSPY